MPLSSPSLKITVFLKLAVRGGAAVTFIYVYLGGVRNAPSSSDWFVSAYLMYFSITTLLSFFSKGDVVLIGATFVAAFPF